VAVPVVLSSLVLIAYWPVLRAQFLNFDDTTQVVINPHVNSGLSLANFRWAFAHSFASNYVPLTWLSHMLCCQIFGLSPWGHHLLNLLLHAVNTVLFWSLVRRLLQTGRSRRREEADGGSTVPPPADAPSPWPALLAACLFGLHPIHVESVAWVVERKDVLSMFFWLLACHAYSKYVAERSTRRYLSVVAFFALGLLAKPMVVTLPFVLLLLDFWPLRRTVPGSAPRLLREKLPLFCIAILACTVTFLTQRSGGAVGTLAHYPFRLRLGNAVVSYVAYLGKILVPNGFSIFVPLELHPLSSAPVLGALLLLLFLTIAAVGVSRRWPWLTVGWLWYLGTLVPVIGLVQVGAQALAWRYAYIPFLGLYLAVAAALDAFVRRRPLPNPLVAFPGGALLLLLSVLTWRQAENWRDNETIFRHSLAHSRRNWMAWSNLGIHLAAHGRYSEAIGCLQQALAIEPGFFQAANALGFALDHVGRHAEAIDAYRRALAIRPGDASTCDNLITVLVHEGKLGEAMELADRLLAMDPSRAPSYLSRGSVLLAQGHADDAIQAFEHVRALEPANDVAQCFLGMAFRQAGQFRKAVELLDQPLKLDDIQRLNRLVTLSDSLAGLREFEKGAQILRQGLHEFPNSLDLLEPLAQIEYTNLKDESNAFVHLRLILQLNPAHPQRTQYETVINYLSRRVSKPAH
jgi:tetratricopeptide (TPR) repeat protein